MEINPNTQELEKIDERLVELKQEKADLLAQKKQLIAKVFSYETNNNCSNQKTDNFKLSTNQKVGLFAHLFQGRKDIYATRWENKQGISGYSVACANEWQPIICIKPTFVTKRSKCSDCRNRSFKPLDNTAIFDHLSLLMLTVEYCKSSYVVIKQMGERFYELNGLMPHRAH